MIRKNPMYDTKTPAGQVRNPLPKTLGEIIDRVQKSEARLAKPAPKSEDYSNGYADGWRDAAAKYGVW